MARNHLELSVLGKQKPVQSSVLEKLRKVEKSVARCVAPCVLCSEIVMLQVSYSTKQLCILVRLRCLYEL